MAQQPKRSRQWLSRALGVLLPGQEHPIRLTLAADRQGLRPLANEDGPLLLAWAIAGALQVAGRPAAKPRRHGQEISLRLDRLVSQVRVRPPHAPPLSIESQLHHLLRALKQGCAPDPALQRRALGYFTTDVEVRRYPPLRIAFNATDLPKLRDGIAAHPLQFVIQVLLGGTIQIIQKAGKQPRGPKARIAPMAAIIRLLACLADEVISHDAKMFRRIQVRAHQEAQYGSDARSVSKLQAIHFVVTRAVQQRWRFDVEAIQPYPEDFARTYLYPYKTEYAALVARCLEIPGVWQRLLAL